MKLILYNGEYIDELEKLLILLSDEVFDCGSVDIDKFINCHTHIYLAIIADEVVGFTSFNVNDYFGLRPSTIGNTYLYVKPEYRRSKALHLFSIQAGLIAKDLDMPLEHYVASDASKLLTKRLKGKEIYIAYEYSVEECMLAVNRLTKRLRIK